MIKLILKITLSEWTDMLFCFCWIKYSDKFLTKSTFLSPKPYDITYIYMDEWFWKCLQIVIKNSLHPALFLTLVCWLPCDTEDWINITETVLFVPNL